MMNQPEIRIANLEDRALIRSISERTWPSTYGHIISQEQIDFMLDWMYSDSSLAAQFTKGHQFFIACLNGSDIGFCSVSEDEVDHETDNTTKKTQQKAFKLNKLYVLPTAQGTGSGKALLEKAIEVAKNAGTESIFLQVNKHNNAYTFYLKNGFVKEAEFKFDIGNGFFMDDYVMRLSF
ncbi:MAG: GNAT family N-acetyltransferase [Sediminibacterium sp.]|nr:GNAT family N-acetyltransferase [Sediminibacterium sp.]